MKLLVEQSHRRLQFVEHVGAQLESISGVGAPPAKQQGREFDVSHAAQSAAALTGHVTLTPSALRLNSSVIVSDVSP